MRQHFASLMLIAILGLISMGSAEEKKPDAKTPKKTPIKVEPTKDGARATYVPKTVGVYVEGGGRQPSRAEPKGEKHAGAGIAIKFGGNTTQNKTPNKAPATNGNSGNKNQPGTGNNNGNQKH